MYTYTIKHHTEETACASCGCPLYVGDSVLMHMDVPYCSEKCYEDAAADWVWNLQHDNLQSGQASPIFAALLFIAICAALVYIGLHPNYQTIAWDMLHTASRVMK